MITPRESGNPAARPKAWVPAFSRGEEPENGFFYPPLTMPAQGRPRGRGCGPAGARPEPGQILPQCAATP
jgi:hypothetical protein